MINKNYTITKEGNRYKVEYTYMRKVKSSGKMKKAKKLDYRQNLLSVLSTYFSNDPEVKTFLDDVDCIINKINI